MLATLLIAVPALGQADMRLRTAPYRADGVTVLKVVPGFVATVSLSADERIESIAVGNAAAWEVTPARSGDRLFVRPLGAAAATNAQIVTDSRQYSLLLQPAFEGDPEAAFQLRFTYPEEPAAAAGPSSPMAASAPAAPAAPAAATATALPGRYRLSGSRLVRPQAISDDGHRTVFLFDEGAVLPAIYAVDPLGHETLVSVRREDAGWVIDRVWQRYVFRAGGAGAAARRLADRRSR